MTSHDHPHINKAAPFQYFTVPHLFLQESGHSGGFPVESSHFGGIPQDSTGIQYV